jgi:hypothetical protein
VDTVLQLKPPFVLWTQKHEIRRRGGQEGSVSEGFLGQDAEGDVEWAHFALPARFDPLRGGGSWRQDDLECLALAVRISLPHEHEDVGFRIIGVGQTPFGGVVGLELLLDRMAS